MIQRCREARLPLQKSKANDPVADVSSFRIVIAFFVRHAVGDFLHVKDGLIKLGHSIVIICVNRDVADRRKHGFLLARFVAESICIQTGKGCQADGKELWKRHEREFLAHPMRFNAALIPPVGAC
jgi:hypothetical protein